MDEMNEFLNGLKQTGLVTPNAILNVKEWNDRKGRGRVEIVNEFGKFEFYAKRVLIKGEVKWVFRPSTS